MVEIMEEVVLFLVMVVVMVLLLELEALILEVVLVE